jgi:transcriptional regulator with XRE-family HTH domain
MPRVNPGRSLRSEQNLARRISLERTRRGWTLETTARRLADVGCPLHSSAVFKIERGQRRIGVDELVAFSKILDISVDELLSPVELVLDARATELVTAWGQTRANLVHVAQPAEERAASAVRDYYPSVGIPSIQGPSSPWSTRPCPGRAN